MTARLYHESIPSADVRCTRPTKFSTTTSRNFSLPRWALAEKEGRPVSLLVVPAADVFEAIIMTAQRMNSSRIVCGLSNKLTPDEQAKLTGDAWEKLPEPRPRLTIEVHLPDGSVPRIRPGPARPAYASSGCRTHAQAVARCYFGPKVCRSASLSRSRFGAPGIAPRANQRPARRDFGQVVG